MKLKSIILISSLFIIIGITLKCNNYYQNYKIQKQEINSIANYLEHKDNNDFVAILEIPKINLKRGLKKDSNVDEDITIIDYQRFLNNDIILASHSGNCSICYFNRLDELKNEDIIYLYKDNVKYTYQIYNIKELKKNSFKIENHNNTITLITCHKIKDDIQIIIEAKIINDEEY